MTRRFGQTTTASWLRPGYPALQATDDPRTIDVPTERRGRETAILAQERRGGPLIASATD